jgi:uncharacterized protein YutE (UPF0331/DUF86 family)
MTSTGLREKVIGEKLALIQKMGDGIKSLPLASYEAFTADMRMSAAAESYIRRALEALMDLGRHILAKGFGRAVAEYKEVARELRDQGVLNQTDADTMAVLAGYRNRMVHFYHDVTPRELYEICVNEFADVKQVAESMRVWVHEHPEMIDSSL